MIGPEAHILESVQRPFRVKEIRKALIKRTDVEGVLTEYWKVPMGVGHIVDLGMIRI